ncbi:MAG: hypothetical protein F6K47_22280 [Symploca sp. SIO2E6]|nr:hypothetical protein [Symploca sp. SIO2E6]
MSFVKKLPLTPLLLLIFTHAVFGWLVSVEAHGVWQSTVKHQSTVVDYDSPLALLWMGGVHPTHWNVFWWPLVKGIVCILLISLALTAPFKLIKTCYSSWLQSDFRAFMSVIVASFLGVMIISSLNVFVRMLVLIAATALARVDLRTANYSEWFAFWLLSIVSLFGYSLGLTLPALK